MDKTKYHLFLLLAGHARKLLARGKEMIPDYGLWKQDYIGFRGLGVLSLGI